MPDLFVRGRLLGSTEDAQDEVAWGRVDPPQPRYPVNDLPLVEVSDA